MTAPAATDPIDYKLDDQVGFVMRRANQRHLALFASLIPELTPTQFAALAKLCELGEISQNALGRATAMDAATIKGVVDRLRRKGFVADKPDPTDQRRLLLKPTAAAWAAYDRLLPRAQEITASTLAPLTEGERAVFLLLLRKLT
ncbi:MarR family winged helix-turn-helix transcriptional regulator [Thiosulfatihalobacter marinus]|uniref:MarR family winged helix-turn-helix transcriptional regulator n=1 Tax=Thiosulfatihalobacter marinus TaxID=2792481 RepID=UPI0018D5AE31|nr:MarR family transcriptional regulator [Thiosulfatihalobacter marinus]